MINPDGEDKTQAHTQNLEQPNTVTVDEQSSVSNPQKHDL